MPVGLQESLVPLLSTLPALVQACSLDDFDTPTWFPTSTPAMQVYTQVKPPKAQLYAALKLPMALMCPVSELQPLSQPLRFSRKCPACFSRLCLHCLNRFPSLLYFQGLHACDPSPLPWLQE